MVDWITFEAVLFDLDGVLTATAQVHARCWKRMFDDYLSGTAGQNVGAARLFELPDDYARLVDGKPRYDGVRSFLSSRGLWLPDGTPADPPSGKPYVDSGIARAPSSTRCCRLMASRPTPTPSTWCGI